MGKSNSKLSPEQLVELQKCTNFEKKELQSWYKGFIRDCPNGFIDRVEFLKIYKQFFPFGDPSKFAEHVFRVFDKETKGRIEFREFIIGMSVTSRGSFDEKLDFAFELYDLDRDGCVRKDDLQTVIDSIYQMVGGVMHTQLDDDNAIETPDRRCERIWRLLDAEGKGVISKEDFIIGSQKDQDVVQALNLYSGLV